MIEAFIDDSQILVHKTVLVIEDEWTIRMLIGDVIDELGHGFEEAANSDAALALLRSDAQIDLLIADVGLPGSLDGRAVVAEARRLRPGLKVLFITGYASSTLFEHSTLEDGMYVLPKPFDIEMLSEQVRMLLA